MKIYVVSEDLDSTDRSLHVFESKEDAVRFAVSLVVCRYFEIFDWKKIKDRMVVMKPYLENKNWKGAWSAFESFDDDCVVLEEHETVRCVCENDAIKEEQAIARLLAKM